MIGKQVKNGRKKVYEVKGRRMLNIIMAVVFPVLAAALMACNSKQGNGGKTEVEFGTIYSYSDYGLVYNRENAYLCDADTGENIVICSKPDCRHGSSKECDGNIGVMSERLFLTDKYEVYVRKPAMEGDMSKGFNDVEIWRADLDGRNRKKISTIKNVQVSLSAAYADGKLAYCYRESNADEVSPDGMFEELDVYRTGVYLIDVEEGDADLVDSREGYDVSMTNAIMSDGKLCYLLTYYDAERDFEWGIDIDWDREYAYTAEHQYKELYCYDIATGENTLIWSGTNQQVFQCGKGYIICSGGRSLKGYLCVITGGKKQEIKDEQYVSNILSSGKYTGAYIYDDNIYLSYGEKFTVYSIATGENHPLAEGKLDDKELRNIEAITGDRLYYSSMEGGEYHIYCVERDLFFNGDISGAVKMW